MDDGHHVFSGAKRSGSSGAFSLGGECGGAFGSAQGNMGAGAQWSEVIHGTVSPLTRPLRWSDRPNDLVSKACIF